MNDLILVFLTLWGLLILIGEEVLVRLCYQANAKNRALREELSSA